MYPVMLDVRRKRCLVVGGGGVALRKVEGLLSDGAAVLVVASEPIEALGVLADRGEIRLERREYEDGEAASFALVFAATDDREVNRRVFEDAERAGVWANVADDPDLCSFHLPARMRRGAFQIAVASAGEAPFVVRRMRQLLERRFGPEWAEWAEAAARFRRSVREADLARDEQERCYDRFFAATVDPENIRARVPTAEEEASLLRPDEPIAAAPVDRHQLARREKEETGFVSLVGAGPGDPGLLTVRARARLLAADAVVFDRLATTALPCDLPPEVELHPVGKRARHHPVPQEEINALLVRLAREGKRVVRLKGGDPFVFGRGGEEAEALVAAGIPWEVVPAVTAGVAVPAYAGIPVTHRSKAVRLTLVTAHESDKEKPQVRWDLLAADPHATLVGYMGVTSLSQVSRQLVDAGMDPATPAALIQRGTTSRQKVVISTISKLHQDGQRAGLRPPAVFVIGPTVGFAKQLDWFSSRPLLGQRLVLCAPAGELGEDLQLAGAEVVEVPLPVTPAARAVMGALPVTGCVLRTPDEVDALEEERDGAGWSPDVVAWCLGDRAAAQARKTGWARIERVQDPGRGNTLISAISSGTNRLPNQ